MRRSIPLLVVILVLQLGLAGLLATRRNPLASITPQTALITVPLEHVDHITIEGQPGTGAAATARVELVKQADHWVLPDYYDAPVDQFRLSSVLSELASLKRGLPIATSSSALKRFKLVDADFERKVTLRAGDKVLSTLYFGSSAGVRKTDARTAAEHAVYDVDLATYELPTSPTDWLDEDILQRNPDSLTQLQIDLAAAREPLKLVRAAPAASAVHAGTRATAPAASTWMDADLPAGKQLDTARADNLAREVAELHIEAILGTQPQPDWQPAHPALMLTITDDQHPTRPVSWTLYAPRMPAAPVTAAVAARARRAAHAAPNPPAQPAEPYYVLKDSAQPWYFKVSSVAGKQLLDDSSPDQLLGIAKPAGRTSAHSGHPVTAARARRVDHTRRAAGSSKPAGA